MMCRVGIDKLKASALHKHLFSLRPCVDPITPFAAALVPPQPRATASNQSSAGSAAAAAVQTRAPQSAFQPPAQPPAPPPIQPVVSASLQPPKRKREDDPSPAAAHSAPVISPFDFPRATPAPPPPRPTIYPPQQPPPPPPPRPIVPVAAASAPPLPQPHQRLSFDSVARTTPSHRPNTFAARNQPNPMDADDGDADGMSDDYPRRGGRGGGGSSNWRGRAGGGGGGYNRGGGGRGGGRWGRSHDHDGEDDDGDDHMSRPTAAASAAAPLSRIDRKSEIDGSFMSGSAKFSLDERLKRGGAAGGGGGSTSRPVGIGRGSGGAAPASLHTPAVNKSLGGKRNLLPKPAPTVDGTIPSHVPSFVKKALEKKGEPDPELVRLSLLLSAFAC